MSERDYSDRTDIHGVVWSVTDPYPLYFRKVDGEIVTNTNPEFYCKCTDIYTCTLHLIPPPPLELEEVPVNDGFVYSPDSDHPWGVDTNAHWSEITPGTRRGYWVKHYSSGGLSATQGSWFRWTRWGAERKAKRLVDEYNKNREARENSWRVT